jgi:hypothetical protein
MRTAHGMIDFIIELKPWAETHGFFVYLEAFIEQPAKNK